MSKPSFYITTTLPYVNSDPHIGFALEIVEVDAIARFKRLQGYDVFFNTGTDEHGQKIYEKAFASGISAQVHVDEYVKRFQRLKESLNLSFDKFIRTTDSEHVAAAEEFWRRSIANGDIYKKQYKAKYCVGCELERHDSELEDGRCFLHPNLELQIIEEENYFFKFSKYENDLLDYYEKNPNFVIPEKRFNEIKAFVKSGLQDFSISRLKEKMSWGVPVPDDPNHVMYVWFDALVNYISTLGWPDEKGNFAKYWKDGVSVQYAGKDNLRQQSAMWQAMLLSAQLPLTKTIVIHGFITADGEKMSKSLGNVVDPISVVNEYGTDALRYYLLREVNPFEDSDFTMERFKDVYNANLANGLGNLTSRIMKMAEDNLSAETVEKVRTSGVLTNFEFPSNYCEAFEEFNIQKVANIVWEYIGIMDRKIQETEPFKLVKQDPERASQIIAELVVDLYKIGRMIEPLMPETSIKILDAVQKNKKPEQSLFNRI